MTEIVRGETAADGLRGYPSLHPRKPQSGEGSRLIEFLYGIRFPDRTVGTAGGYSRGAKTLKTQKESAKSRQSRNNDKLLALSNKVHVFFIFSPMG